MHPPFTDSFEGCVAHTECCLSPYFLDIAHIIQLWLIACRLRHVSIACVIALTELIGTNEGNHGGGRDAEEADVEKERAEQRKGPAARQHELEELAQIYEDRGLSPGLALQVQALCCVSGDLTCPLLYNGS